MHRIPIQQRHIRSGWLWSALGVLAVIGAVVWIAQPQQQTCDTTHALTESRTTVRMPVPGTAAPVAPAPTTPAPQPVVSGEARYYSFSQGVACSFPDLPLDGFWVGMSTQEYGRADACGAYLDIRGPLGDVRAQVVDRCPGCAPGQLDLSTAAFDRIADRHDGVAKITYSVVRNPEPAPELSYEVKPDSSPQWLAILFSGAGNPLRQVAIRQVGGGPWQELNRGMDNYWTMSTAGPGPFAARVTDIHGNQAEVFGISLEPGQRATGARLYASAPPPVPVSLPPVTSPTTLVVPRPQPAATRPTGCVG